MKEDRYWIYESVSDSTMREAILGVFNEEIRAGYFVEELAFDAVKKKWIVKLIKKIGKEI